MAYKVLRHDVCSVCGMRKVIVYSEGLPPNQKRYCRSCLRRNR